MELLPKNIQARIPQLYATEHIKDPVAQVKFFAPWNHWKWFVTEFDGEDTLFGWVCGDFPEWGYFSLSELESVHGPFGLTIERDVMFKPCKMSVVQEQQNSV